MPLGRAQFGGENPIRARRHLGEKIGKSARRHPRGRGAHHVQIGDDHARRGAGIRLLGAFRTAQRRAEAGIAVHARGGPDGEIRQPQLTRRALGDVVHDAAADGDRHERAAVPLEVVHRLLLDRLKILEKLLV